ncbi:MAG TPA: restriction endonuclease subunit S [Klebsiella sp.]
MTTHLSEICSKPQYGYTTKSSSMGDIKFLRTTDITKGAVDWSSVPYCMDAPEDVSKYQLQDRDIVISRAGSVGFSFLVQNPPRQVVFASYLIRFKPVNYFSEYYLKRFLESSDYWSQLSLMSAGNAVQNVNAQKLSKLTVPIPPIAEQKIIAEKLDTLLAQVNSTRARLEQIPQILKRFRQAVLASATSGKLTETWRQNNNLCHPKEIIIDNIVESSFYGPRFSKNDYTFETNGIPTIRTTDMERGNIIITDGTPRVCVPNEKIEQFKVQKHDLLVTRTGSIGVMALFTEDYLAIPSAYLIRFRFKKNINSKYIYLCLTAPKGQQQMGLSATAITQSNINAKSIRNINICYPEITEQHEIVRRVEQLFAYADTIEKQVNSALTRVNHLTQSILAKAFRGELTALWRAENPSLISGENSAAALLEKIKAERAASGGKKSSRKKS